MSALLLQAKSYFGYLKITLEALSLNLLGCSKNNTIPCLQIGHWNPLEISAKWITLMFPVATGASEWQTRKIFLLLYCWKSAQSHYLSRTPILHLQLNKKIMRGSKCFVQMSTCHLQNEIFSLEVLNIFIVWFSVYTTNLLFKFHMH